jgi:hypothetical protein
MERFNLKKLSEVKSTIMLKSHIVSHLWKTSMIRWILIELVKLSESIKLSAKESLGYNESKKHKPRFDEGCSKLLDQRKQAKMRWLQDPSEINGDNLNNAKREARRHFRNKTREYLKNKINEVAMNCKNKYIRDLYRGINEFKTGYQPRSNLVKDENGNLLADSHNILNGRRTTPSY